MAAVEEVRSPDGVLVLMDLGSALMSAEMALEMLDPDGGPVTMSAAPLVEGAVAAAARARGGADLDEVAREARGALAMKTSQLEEEEEPAAAEAAPAVAGDGALEGRFAVENRLGLHARPAGRIVSALGGLDAQVTLESGGRTADARSLTAIAVLAVRRGGELIARAGGPDAQRALDALAALAAGNWGDDERGATARPGRGGARAGPPPTSATACAARPRRPASPSAPPGGSRPSSPRSPRRRRAARPRSAPGSPRRATPSARTSSPPAARSAAPRPRSSTPTGCCSTTPRSSPPRSSASPTARRRAPRGATPPGRRPPPSARSTTPTCASAPWTSRTSRAACWRGSPASTAARCCASPGIVLADELTPGEAAALDPERAFGLVTARGGATGHAAIVARALGIPAVIGAGPDVLAIADGTPLALDGGTGVVDVDPGAQAVADYEARRDAEAAARAEALAAAAAPATLADGTRIEVFANLGAPGEAANAVAQGAEGVGLLRTEFLFLDRETAPTEDEQVELLTAVATGMEGRPVVVRTLDAGADKPLPFLRQATEDNPFLGVRGIRLSLRERDAVPHPAARDPPRRRAASDRGDVPDGRDAPGVPRGARAARGGADRARRRRAARGGRDGRGAGARARRRRVRPRGRLLLRRHQRPLPVRDGRRARQRGGRGPARGGAAVRARADRAGRRGGDRARALGRGLRRARRRPRGGGAARRPRRARAEHGARPDPGGEGRSAGRRPHGRERGGGRRAAGRRALASAHSCRPLP